MARRAGFGHDDRFLLGGLLLVPITACLLLGWPKVALAISVIQVPLLAWYLYDYLCGKAP